MTNNQELAKLYVRCGVCNGDLHIEVRGDELIVEPCDSCRVKLEKELTPMADDIIYEASAGVLLIGRR